ncbi:MAG: sigma-70 family RNA polymerase sigma factor [Deltaproteobacteria bacterium]|nr:sigma-70 family RNA polymerase sigma factor [Deltaproteobacteria bacterium]
MGRTRGKKNTKTPPSPAVTKASATPAADETGEEEMLDESIAAPQPVAETALDRILSEPQKNLVSVRDPARHFVEEARRHARLDAEVESELGRRAREHGDLDAARRLVVHNLRLVVAIAYQYRQAWLNILDLFQEGSVGLMEAVRRWDPDVGTRFGSYAAYWIRAYVLRFLMTNARLIHVGNTRAGRKLFFRLERERQKLLAAGFDPTPKLLAAKLDVDEADVIEVSGHLASREISFEPRSDDEGVPLAERVARREASPEDQAARNELAQAVRRLMEGFEGGLSDARDIAVWREHLASSASEPVSLAALGERYGVSKQRMGQIAEKLKKQFRERVLEELGADIQMAWQTEDA